MESETSTPENDFPEVVNMQGTDVESVQAELVRASSSQIKRLTAQEVDLRDSIVVVAEADTVNARRVGMAHLEAGNLTLLDGTILAARTNSAIINGRAALVVSDLASIENGVTGVLVGRDVRGDRIRTKVLISRNVQGNVETLLDTRSTLMVGMVAGAVAGTILMLGRFLFRRK